MHIAPKSNSDLPEVKSPYEGKTLRAIDHLKLSCYWFGSNFVWGALLGPVMAKQMEAEVASWGPVLQKAGIKLD